MTKEQARALNGASQKGILIALGVMVSVGVLGAVTSPENTTAILGFCTLVIVQLLALLAQISTAKKLDASAEKVEEFETALVEKNIRTNGKLDSIHALVDGAMPMQLKISWVALLRIAELTKHPDDIAAAQIAEKLWREHDAKHATAISEAAKNKELMT